MKYMREVKIDMRFRRIGIGEGRFHKCVEPFFFLVFLIWKFFVIINKKKGRRIDKNYFKEYGTIFCGQLVFLPGFNLGIGMERNSFMESSPFGRKVVVCRASCD